MNDRLKGALDRLDKFSSTTLDGRVTGITGLVVRAVVPNARIGELMLIESRSGESLRAEVVGFRENECLMMPLGDLDGIGPDCKVSRVAEGLTVPAGEALLGRVLNGLGEPLDDGPSLNQCQRVAVHRSPPPALTRPPIAQPLITGLSVIDGLLTVGQGQRVGLFAAAGVGKSSLLGQIARQADVDVSVVCLIGERGRELREFIDDALGAGLARSVVVCATSDAPALERLHAANVATAIAEAFRDQGQHVLLLMDSLTRYARALREVGLAAGELPARRGYPPSTFAALPRLVERAGTAPTGLISAIYTVLVEGDDMDEPIADEVRGLLDGHVVLSRRLAERGHFPAIDVPRSLSRVMPRVIDADHEGDAQALRALIAAYEAQREMISLGAYRAGSDPQVDQAIGKMPEIEGFLRQVRHETRSLEQTRALLSRLGQPGA